MGPTSNKRPGADNRRYTVFNDTSNMSVGLLVETVQGIDYREKVEKSYGESRRT